MAINLARYTVRIYPDWTVLRRQVATEAATLRATLGAPVAIRVTFPTAASVGAQIGREAAREFARAFRATLAALPTPPVPGPTVRQSTTSGATSGGAYARAFRAATDEAIRNLPAARVTLIRLPQVDREIAALQRDLGHLNNQRIGIDIDAATALAEVDRIQRELHRLGSTHTNVQVRADTAAAALRLAQLRAQLAGLGQAGTQAGQQFNRGLLQQLASLNSAMGPIGIAMATAIVVSAAPLIAAGIVAAILLAVGGGVLAAGIAAAAQDPRIAAAFGALGAKAKQIFITMGEDFKEPLLRAVGTFATSLDRIAPTLRAMSTAMAPLVDKLAPALAHMVENVMPGLQKALEASTPLFEVIADKAPELGTAISKFFTAIADGGPGAQQFLRDMFDFLIFVIPKIGEGLGWLSNAWKFYRGFVIIAITEVQVAWALFRGAFEAVRIAIGFGIDAIMLWYHNMADAVKAAIAAIRSGWDAAWAWIRDHIFSPMAAFITDTIPNAFQRGVDFIGAAWDRLRAIARAPVDFFINTVVNKGIIGTFRAVAKFIPGLPAIDDIHPPGFAHGGQLPGYSDVDNMVAIGPGGHPLALAGGEWIINARQSAKHGRLLQAINSGMDGFADGGIIGAITNPAGWVKDRIDGLIGAIPGGGMLRDVMVGAGRQMVAKTIDWLKSLFSTTTSSIVGLGKGVIGAWPSSPAAQRGDSGVWRTIVAIINATGPISGSFGNAYRPGDPLWHGSGRAVDWMGFNQDALAVYLSLLRPLELIHRTGRRDYAYTRGVNKGSFNNTLMEQHRNHIHIAMNQGGLLAKVFDSGGIMRPGDVGVNTGSRNELVVPEGMKIALSDDTIARLGDRIAQGVGRVLNGASMTALHIGRARA